MLSETLLYWASRPVVTTYTHLMLQMDVRQHSELPAGPKIIAANHPSTTDPFFVAAMLRQQSFILIKESLFQVPVFGRYLRSSGHIPVEAGKGQVALDEALQRLAEGHTVIIFPEGILSPPGGCHPPRTGVARLALLSGAPVIPVGIHLDRQRMHTIQSTVRGKVEYGSWYFRGPYHLTTGRPLLFAGSVEDHGYVRQVAERIMRQIIALSHESEQRMNPSASPLAQLPEALA